MIATTEKKVRKKQITRKKIISVLITLIGLVTGRRNEKKKKKYRQENEKTIRLDEIVLSEYIRNEEIRINIVIFNAYFLSRKGPK